MAVEPRGQRGVHQLPRGRHGLSRDFVEANQRQRILDAVADVVSLVGYQAMSVEAVVGGAGVSRRTFYDNFKSKEDAFLTAYEEIGAELLMSVQASFDSADTFPAGVIGCVRAFLEFVAARPHYADMCIVEVLAAGPAALARRNAVMAAFARMLHEGAELVEELTHPPELTAETVVGGIYEIVYSRVLQGRTAELPQLLPDLAYSMMLPYLGHAAAERAVAGLRADVALRAEAPLRADAELQPDEGEDEREGDGPPPLALAPDA
jgi:AcrR family transcriptional regulator